MRYRVMRPDGSVRWIHSRSFPVHDSRGKFIRVVGIAEDVTERRHRKNALEQIHQKLNTALEEANRQTREAAQLTELVDILQSCQTAEEAYKIIEGFLQSAFGFPAGGGALSVLARSNRRIAGRSSGARTTTGDCCHCLTSSTEAGS